MAEKSPIPSGPPFVNHVKWDNQENAEVCTYSHLMAIEGYEKICMKVIWKYTKNHTVTLLTEERYLKELLFFFFLRKYINQDIKYNDASIVMCNSMIWFLKEYDLSTNESSFRERSLGTYRE